MSFREMRKHTLQYASAFFKWFLVSLMLGAFCGGIGIAFHFCVEEATVLRGANPWLLYLLPLAGLLIVFLYRLTKMQDNTGTNCVLENIRAGGHIPLRLAPLIFIGTVLTQLCGGSAGREGAALQIGGSFGAFCGRTLRLGEKDMRLVTMCGMAAFFSAVFGTPLTAAIFSMEVISVGIFYFSALIPCIVASFTAYFLLLLCGYGPLSFPIQTLAFEPVTIGKVLLLAVLFALVSILICVSLKASSKFFSKYLKNDYLRVLCGGVLVIALSLICGTTTYNGAGMEYIVRIMGGQAAAPWDFAVKLLFTCITIGTLYKGGEIVPTLFIGASFGCAAGTLLGLDPVFSAAVGLVAVFCGVVNCPITSILMSVELFGSGNLLYFALACAVSFMLSGRFSLYSAQKLVYSKLEPTLLNTQKEP